MGKTDTSAIEEILHQELIKSAEEIPGTEAVYKGRDSGGGKDIIYYFIIPGKYDPKIEEILTEADTKLSRKYPSLNKFSLMRWPIHAEQASNYSFLGECIYQKR